MGVQPRQAVILPVLCFLLCGLAACGGGKREKELQAALEEAREELKETRRQLGETGALYEALQAKYQKLKDSVSWNSLQGPISSSPEAAIDAEVSATKVGLVVLNAGRNQGVQPGFEFAIHRDGKVIGMVKVTKIYEDLSGANILKTVKGFKIQAGDKARCKLNPGK